MSNSINFSEDSSVFKIPTPSASGDGLLNLLNFNNELVMNLIQLVNKEQNHFPSENNCVPSAKSNSHLGSHLDHRYKRKFAHEMYITTNKDAKREVEVDEASLAKRTKALHHNRFVEHQRGTNERESVVFHAKDKDLMLSDLMSHVAVLQNQIKSQTEEISLLRNQVASAKINQPNTPGHRSSEKNPYEVESQLQEVVQLQFTFTKLVDSFSTGESESNTDDDLSQFRTEVNQLFKQAHRKLSRWKKNQHDMFKELQITKQLLLKSLAHVIHQKTIKQNQTNKMIPVRPTPLQNTAQGSPSKPVQVEPKLTHKIRQKSSESIIPNITSSDRQSVFMPYRPIAAPKPSHPHPQFYQQTNKPSPPQSVALVVSPTTQNYPNFESAHMQQQMHYHHRTFSSMNEATSTTTSPREGYHREISHDQFALHQDSYHHPFLTPPPMEHFNSKEHCERKEIVRKESLPPTRVAVIKQASPSGNQRHSPVNSNALDADFPKIIKAAKTPPPALPKVNPPTETNVNPNGDAEVSKLFICENCGDTFATHVQLRLHTKVVHESSDKTNTK